MLSDRECMLSCLICSPTAPNYSFTRYMSTEIAHLKGTCQLQYFCFACLKRCSEMAGIMKIFRIICMDGFLIKSAAKCGQLVVVRKPVQTKVLDAHLRNGSSDI